MEYDQSLNEARELQAALVNLQKEWQNYTLQQAKDAIAQAKTMANGRNDVLSQLASIEVVLENRKIEPGVALVQARAILSGLHLDSLESTLGSKP